MSIKLYPLGHQLVGSHRILSLTVNHGFLIGARTFGSNLRPLGVAPWVFYYSPSSHLVPKSSLC